MTTHDEEIRKAEQKQAAEERKKKSSSTTSNNSNRKATNRSRRAVPFAGRIDVAAPTKTPTKADPKEADSMRFDDVREALQKGSTAAAGPHHKEERMPAKIEELLRLQGGVNSRGVIPVIAQLLEKSTVSDYSYLCHPETQHISKLKGEGSFCGYRNIQMLVTYMIGAAAENHELFNKTVPSIFDIQDAIEAGWDDGINAKCRDEIGPIKGTRKYIGTIEADTYFEFLGIRHASKHISGHDSKIKSRKAEEEEEEARSMLYDEVELYFSSSLNLTAEDRMAKVRRTTRAPIYLQYDGHSLTIIGLERKLNGRRKLLVFNPAKDDPQSVKNRLGQQGVEGVPVEETLNKHYRRGSRQLQKLARFDLLMLLNKPTPPR
ncbi:hypothetical protein M426DRAFT_319470 [Hypoxylon sp. CI-4A]|nr:hypothetical protein M426DRAFT_319470 [Hypoxylon sp. CI-4A]